MKSKHDSSSDSRDSGSNGVGKNDESMSDGGDRSRSRTRSRSLSPSSKKDRSSKDKVDHDALSIYIGNVDYSATEEELRDAFIGCGDIVRVTIIKNMKTGHPKGAAFIEFTDKDGVQAAMLLNGKEVKGRALTVTSKKPKPEKRPREKRSEAPFPYDRRGPRSAPPYYAAPYGARLPYGPPARGGYYPMPAHVDTRRGGHPASMHHMQVDQSRLQSRYDPYRRPEFYDPYMMPRGAGSHAPPPPAYYHHSSDKYGASSSSTHHSRTSQPPQRYSNPFNRR